MARVYGLIIFVLYILVGLYLLNYPLQLIKMPGFILSIEGGIFFVGGILVIVGGVRYLFSSGGRRVTS